MFKHILIATDGSELAAKAVGQGLALAKSLGAKVSIVTASEMWSAMDMASAAERGKSHPVEDYETGAAVRAQTLLASCAAEAAKAGVCCETQHIRDKEPAEAIVGAAKARGCDLIVMASHGRTGIERLLLGSVASKVLSISRTPVLIWR